MALMIAEANLFCAKLGLKQDRPLSQEDVRPGSHVSPPRSDYFGGSLATDECSFGFGSGHLANFRLWPPTHRALALAAFVFRQNQEVVSRMRFHFGAVPETEDFPADDSWKPLREPGPILN
jgi:hypothetical protein